MRVLGIDYGKKKVGVAIGDMDLKVASPVTVWKNDGEKSIVDRIADFVGEENIGMIVVGVPKKGDGDLTEQGKINERFAIRLAASVNVPVQTLDESFTSVESKRLQTEYGTDVKEDALSAMLIVQDFFDRP